MQGAWNEDQCKKDKSDDYMNGSAKPKGMQRCITLDRVPLEHVSRFKYLGSWITEDARSDEDIRARWEWLKQPFGKIKN